MNVKKITSLVLTVIMTAMVLAGCGSGSEVSEQPPAEETDAPSAASDEESSGDTSAEGGVTGKTIGFINAGADDYYASYGDALVTLAKEQGMEVIELNSNYSSETELANCQDLISKGVDAIACITAGAAGSAATIKAANDAGVPIFFCVGKPETEEGTSYQGWVSDNYAMIGYELGKWTAEHYPDASGKIALIPGVFGQNTAEAEIVGFNMGLEENGLEDAYVTASGEWAADKAIPVVEDLISSGRDIDVLFACNEEMARGALQVMEEQGINDIDIISINGKEEGWEWLEEGKVQAFGVDCPNLDADLCVQQMVRYFNGETFEADLNIKPSMILTKDNIEDAIPWVIDDYLAARESGKITYDLESYEAAAKENKELFAQFDQKLADYLEANN